MEYILPITALKSVLPLLAILAGIFVITTQNAIISIFNLIVLYILVAFYLIYVGIAYLGISFVIIYVGAIAILFLFIIMMIDIEVVDKRSNNYLPLLFFLLSGFLISFKNIIYYIGVIKMSSIYSIREFSMSNDKYDKLFNESFHLSINSGPDSSQDSIYDNIISVSKSNEGKKNNKEVLRIKDDKEGLDIYINMDNIEIIDNIKDQSENEDQSEKNESVVRQWDQIRNRNMDDEKDKFNNRFIYTDEELDKLYGYPKLLGNEEFVKSVHEVREQKEIIRLNGIKDNKILNSIHNEELMDKEGLLYKEELLYNYVLIIPNWDTAAMSITQVSAIGEILYMIWHSFIYIISAILLVGMVGSIILTADKFQETRIMHITKTHESGIGILVSVVFMIILLRGYYSEKIKEKVAKFLFQKCERNENDKLKLNSKNKKGCKDSNKERSEYVRVNSGRVGVYNGINTNGERVNWKYCNKYGLNKRYKNDFWLSQRAFPFIIIPGLDGIYSEDVIGNLLYFVIANLLIALLLLSVNSYFSLSNKYIDKGGGFECGFTSFVQTRERFNVVFYRVSLLFLVFDLEIVLIFPYPAMYGVIPNNSKNNVLAFIYILIVGFIYELKEGALNFVKKAHSTELNIIV